MYDRWLAEMPRLAAVAPRSTSGQIHGRQLRSAAAPLFGGASRITSSGGAGPARPFGFVAMDAILPQSWQAVKGASGSSKRKLQHPARMRVAMHPNANGGRTAELGRKSGSARV